jgi:hypothetical protein
MRIPRRVIGVGGVRSSGDDRHACERLSWRAWPNGANTVRRNLIRHRLRRYSSGPNAAARLEALLGGPTSL